MHAELVNHFHDGRRSGSSLCLRVQPRSSRTGPLGTYGNSQLKWGVYAAPVENAANEELLKSVAAYFNLPVGKVHLLKGATSRTKVVLLEDRTPEEVLQLLKLSPDGA